MFGFKRCFFYSNFNFGFIVNYINLYVFDIVIRNGFGVKVINIEFLVIVKS